MGGWNAGLPRTQASGDSNAGYFTAIEDACVIVDRDSVRSRRHDRSRVVANGKGPILSSNRCLSCFAVFTFCLVHDMTHVHRRAVQILRAGCAYVLPPSMSPASL